MREILMHWALVDIATQDAIKRLTQQAEDAFMGKLSA